MKLKLVAIVALLVFTTQAFAQKSKVSKGDIKKYDKAEVLFDKGDYEGADKILAKLTTKYPWHYKMWDMLTKVRYYDYLVALQSKGTQRVTVTTSKNGKEDDSGSDMLAKMLSDMLNSAMDPSVEKKKLLINTCKEATLKSYLPSGSDVILRNLLIDEPVDTAINPDAIEQFEDAEREFRKGNYNSAIKYYKKAIELDDRYYKARLYLGDAYYMKKDYTLAVRYFKDAIKTCPKELEPRKYLVDALFYMGSYEEALDECKDAIIIYPDVIMFDKLAMVGDKMGLEFNKYWIPRGVFPNRMGITPTENKNKLWQPYIDAHGEIESFCDERGVITKTTNLTTSRYSEVYAWEQLLKKAPATNFLAARKMQSLGYLDCYVFVSEFHIDIYDQYKDFTANNRDRIIKYFDLLLTK